MSIRLKEAIKFHNESKKIENKRLGLPENTGLTNQAKIARLIWPNMDPGSARKTGSKLAKGGYRGITLEMVNIICDQTGVDPNFLFGYES